MKTLPKTPKELICVLTDIAAYTGEGHVPDMQYVPVAEVPACQRRPGTTVFCGRFYYEQERCGPSGSHVRWICTPAGDLRKAVLL